MNSIHPTIPPVPFPPVRISVKNIVTITPTNLYPLYATKSRNCDSLVMPRMYMATFNTKISNMTTPRAVEAFLPNNSGLKVPCMPARKVESSVYVINDIVGMYMSGLFRSSRGGR